MKITETNRLLIEQATLDDAAFVLRLLNSPNWLEYIGDRAVRTEAHAREYIRKQLLASYESNGFGLFKISLKTEHAPIGLCGFLKRDYLEEPDIGFAILPEYERQGFTFEAANALMSYGKNTLNLDRILAITLESNTASRKLLGKLGLNEIGTVKPNSEKAELLLFSN